MVRTSKADGSESAFQLEVPNSETGRPIHQLTFSFVQTTMGVVAMKATVLAVLLGCVLGMADFNQGGAQSGTDTKTIFVPVLLNWPGLNNSFFTSELTLTNRGSETVVLNYTYMAHRGGGNGIATDMLGPMQQKIETDAMDYLRGLGVPIPETGSQIGSLRVDVSGASEVVVMVRTTTAVPEGRAGLAYFGVPRDEGFLDEAVYLCGLRQNQQDRSNVAVQNMGSEGEITVRATVFSGNPADRSGEVLDEVKLKPGGFHQYNAVLKDKGDPVHGGYVKVERVAGEAPFYAYGVINDQVNSDGSFVFPVSESSLEGVRGQALPVIVEAGQFTSELILTNFSDKSKVLNLTLSEYVPTDELFQSELVTVPYSLELKAGQQRIIPSVIDVWRAEEIPGIDSFGESITAPLFAEEEDGEMSGIVIGARTGSPDANGGQYSVFYTAVPERERFTDSAWIFGLQQNAENRGNLAIVNTGEIDDSSSEFRLEIYDGHGMLVRVFPRFLVAPREWFQRNGILNSAPGVTQGYVRILKHFDESGEYGNNPFLAYGVVNDGERPGKGSGDGAYIPARE